MQQLRWDAYIVLFSQVEQLSILLYDSAVRLAEIQNLRVNDICLNEENPYIRVIGKGSKERVVAINVKTVKHVKQYLMFIAQGTTRIPICFSIQSLKAGPGKCRRAMWNGSYTVS